MRTSKTDPQINIRIPATLKAEIEANAKANGRSVNAEIVCRLLLSRTPVVDPSSGRLRQHIEDSLRDSAIKLARVKQMVKEVQETLGKSNQGLGCE